MTEYVAESIRPVIEDPDDSARIELVLRVEESSVAAVAGWVEDNGGSVEEDGPFGLLLVDVPEPVVAELRELAAVDSIEGNDPAGVLDRGNPQRPGG